MVFCITTHQRAVRHMLEVYLAKGWASRIHFERYPDTVERQHAIMEDCLYRAKGAPGKPGRGWLDWTREGAA